MARLSCLRIRHTRFVPSQQRRHGEQQDGFAESSQYCEPVRIQSSLASRANAPLRQFASFRSPLEEREYSRRAFYTFLEFIGVTCFMHYVAVKAWNAHAALPAP